MLVYVLLLPLWPLRILSSIYMYFILSSIIISSHLFFFFFFTIYILRIPKKVKWILFSLWRVSDEMSREHFFCHLLLHNNIPENFSTIKSSYGKLHMHIYITFIRKDSQNLSRLFVCSWLMRILFSNITRYMCVLFEFSRQYLLYRDMGMYFYGKVEQFHSGISNKIF